MSKNYRASQFMSFSLGLLPAALVCCTAVAVIVACLAVVRASAQGLTSTNETSTTQVSDLRRFNLSSGGISALSYHVAHDVTAHMDVGKAFPSVRISREQFPAEFAGMYADGGWQSAWLAPRGQTEFYLATSFVESIYFSNRLFSFSGDVVPLEAGDHCELAVANTPADNPEPWDRARSAARGTMQWDTGQDSVRRVTSSYGQTTGGMDVLFVRADMVARGGDVDARTQDVRLPPLVIDLPGIYPQEALGAFQSAIFFPQAQYITLFKGQVLPQTGKAVFTASVRGYIPEAKEYTLPGGAQIKEWHLSVEITITLTGPSIPLQARTTTYMPAGGIVVAGEGGTITQLSVDPGGTVLTGVGIEPHVVGGQLDPSTGSVAPLVRDSSDASNVGINHPLEQSGKSATTAGLASPVVANEPSDAVLINELKAAAPINHELSGPVDLLIGNRNYSLTLDPDYRGEGILALRSLRRAKTGTPYLNALTFPYAMVDGTPIKLDRSRLVDLRVTPMIDDVRVEFTGGNNSLTEPISYYRRHLGIAPAAGLGVKAVYDVGDGRYAFLTIDGYPKADVPGTIRSEMLVKSLTGAISRSSAVQYLELASPGPVTYNGNSMTNEFSGPLDLFGSFKNLLVGNYSITGTINGRRADGTYADGVATVVRAPAPLVSNPVPASGVSIDGQPIALYYTAPPDAPPSSTGVSFTATTLVTDGTPPVANPKPIGELCATPQVVDQAASDAPAQYDIRRGWFDADDANVYATIELAQLPTAADAGTTIKYFFPFRYEHAGYAAAAILDDAGNWTFQFGYQGNTGSGFGMTDTVSGEVKPGSPGHIRIAVPRNLRLTGYQNGEYLRDTSVLSYKGTQLMDHAPEETTANYGAGGDYIVDACGLIPVQLAAVVSRKTHGSAGTFDVDLPLTGPRGIECRSGGVNGDYLMIFKFANELTSVGGASASATQEGGGNQSVTATGSINPADRKEYIVNLTGVPNAQVLTVSLANVNDSAGNSSASVSASMGILLGDTTGNGVVDSGDITQVRRQSGQVTAEANKRIDLSVDGVINSGDITLVRRQSGTALPTP